MAATVTALTLSAGLVVTGCTDAHKPGPAGRVVAKNTDRNCHSSGSGKHRHRSCDTDYQLTVRTKNGDRAEFDVSSADYDRCRRGSAYPRCTKAAR